MALPSITILGGDLRNCYTAEYLYSRGWQVQCYHTLAFPFSSGIRLADCLSQAFGHSDLILAPTPLSKDGKCLFQAGTAVPACPFRELLEALAPEHKLVVFTLPKELYSKITEKGCQILSLAQSLEFTKENALLTAEGLLAEVLRCTPFSLSCSNVLILGYGHCGTAISRLFRPLCQKIYVVEENIEKQKQAKHDGLYPISTKEFKQVLPQCQILINTIPAPVLEPAVLQLLHSCCHIFDIASAPFGFPADITEKCLLPYYRIPGIPGRFSPITAGEAIGRTIERMTEHDL